MLDPAAISAIVDRLADEISGNYRDDLIVVSVLKGSIMFISDLCRRLSLNPLVDFVALSPYVEGEKVRMLKDVSIDIEGAEVLLVHDIIDTGLSTSFLVGELTRHQPRSLSVCTLIDKPARRLLPVEIHYTGQVVEDDFLIGYGLDFAGRYRNLGVIAAADPVALSADPDCYRAWAYPFDTNRG